MTACTCTCAVIVDCQHCEILRAVVTKSRTVNAVYNNVNSISSPKTFHTKALFILPLSRRTTIAIQMSLECFCSLTDFFCLEFSSSCIHVCIKLTTCNILCMSVSASDLIKDYMRMGISYLFY